jgi:hypothetical protein
MGIGVIDPRFLRHLHFLLLRESVYSLLLHRLNPLPKVVSAERLQQPRADIDSPKQSHLPPKPDLIYVQ